MNYKKICDYFNIEINNHQLYVDAFTHSSFANERKNGIRDYENIQNFNQNSMIADFGRYFYQIMNNVSANKVVNSKRDSYDMV